MKYTLENVEVEKPCPVGWETMNGTEEVRHCAECQHEVYNISEMSKRRALKVLNQKESSICIGYYRDSRNRIVTQSYFGIFKRHLVKALSATLAIIFSFTSLHAMQVKNSNPKKNKVVRHRSHRKQSKPPQVLGKTLPRKKPTLGLLP